MKRRIKEIQDEFAILFKVEVEKKGLRYMGCEPVELDESGEPVNKNDPKTRNYTKEYIKLLKNFEQNLLNEKSKIVKQQNRDYYRDKCKELLSNAYNDSYCRAAACLMLNSDSEHLNDLKAEYEAILKLESK